jgi:zinc transport system substrate-binding protein
MPLFIVRGLIAFLFLFVTASTAIAGERLSIYVSILPQKNLVERIGGEHVDVSVMVGPGQNPATYEPTPRQMAGLAGADIYYRIGVPFEKAWMQRIRAANPEMDVLDAREGVTLRRMEPAGGHHHDFDQHGHGHQHEEGEADPHIWLSPPLIKILCTGLRDRLQQLDPDNREHYQRNYADFMRELEQLDRDIRSRLQGLERRDFMVFHPSWGYFADAYKLRQIPIESAGKEPGARTLARLIEEAQEQGVRVIFVQQQFSTKQARALADAIGGKVVTIDPLAQDYPGNLRQVAQAIAEANR